MRYDLLEGTTSPSPQHLKRLIWCLLRESPGRSITVRVKTMQDADSKYANITSFTEPILGDVKFVATLDTPKTCECCGQTVPGTVEDE